MNSILELAGVFFALVHLIVLSVGSAALLKSYQQWGEKVVPAILFFEFGPLIIGTTVLLLLCIGNLFVGIAFLFPVFWTVTLLVLSLIWVQRHKLDMKSLVKDATIVAGIGLAVMLMLFFFYGAGSLWSREAANHDSIIYFEGLKWAKNRGLWVDSATIQSLWGFPIERESNSIFIGLEATVNRSGTYSLIAFGHEFIPNPSGMTMLYSLVVPGTLVSFFLLGLLQTRERLSGNKQNSLVSILLLGLPFTSTAFLGTVINSNFGTTMGAYFIAVVVGLSLTDSHTRKDSALVFGLVSALGVICYGETLVYITPIVIWYLVFWKDPQPLVSPANRFFSIGYSIFIYLACLAIFGGLPLIKSVESILFIDGISKINQWASWYIHQPFWTWFGAFYAGELPGSAVISSTWVAVVGVALFLMTLYLIIVAKKIREAYGFLFLCLFFILYISIKGYQYGEHKILQIFGIGFVTLTSVGIVLLLNSMSSQLSKVLLTSGLSLMCLLLSIDYLNRANTLLVDLQPYHALSRDFPKVLAEPRSGDTVLFGDSRLVGVEKFYKSHYLIFGLAERNVRTVMSEAGDDRLRAGYFAKTTPGTLRTVDTVDWLVDGRGSLVKKSVFNRTLAAPLSFGEYEVFDLRGKKIALAEPGSGWWEPESESRWTKGVYSIETLVTHDRSAKFVMVVDYFYPPADGFVHISLDENQIATFPATQKVIELDIPKGLHKVVFEPSWQPQSPKDREVSADPRKLFTLVHSVEIQ